MLDSIIVDDMSANVGKYIITMAVTETIMTVVVAEVGVAKDDWRHLRRLPHLGVKCIALRRINDNAYTISGNLEVTERVIID
jgi:hypothetical protein